MQGKRWRQRLQERSFFVPDFGTFTVRGKKETGASSTRRTTSIGYATTSSGNTVTGTRAREKTVALFAVSLVCLTTNAGAWRPKLSEIKFNLNVYSLSPSQASSGLKPCRWPASCRSHLVLVTSQHCWTRCAETGWQSEQYFQFRACVRKRGAYCRFWVVLDILDRIRASLFRRRA